MKNPYTLLFGRSPEQYIQREADTEEIIRNFEFTNPTEQVYMITGVRGSGKTVFMTDIANRLKKENEWVIINLSSESDLLKDFASLLASENSRAELFKKAKINLSFWGLLPDFILLFHSITLLNTIINSNFAYKKRKFPLSF